MLRTCIYCREKVPPDANFGSQCGARLPYMPRPEPEETETVKATGHAKEELSPVFTVSELAKYLKTSKGFVYGLANRGEIGHLKVGRRYLFPMHAVDEWLKKSCARRQDWHAALDSHKYSRTTQPDQTTLRAAAEKSGTAPTYGFTTCAIRTLPSCSNVAYTSRSCPPA